MPCSSPSTEPGPVRCRRSVSTASSISALYGSITAAWYRVSASVSSASAPPQPSASGRVHDGAGLTPASSSSSSRSRSRGVARIAARAAPSPSAPSGGVRKSGKYGPSGESTASSRTPERIACLSPSRRTERSHGSSRTPLSPSVSRSRLNTISQSGSTLSAICVRSRSPAEKWMRNTATSPGQVTAHHITRDQPQGPLLHWCDRTW